MMTVDAVPETPRCVTCGTETPHGEALRKTSKPPRRLFSAIWENVLNAGKLSAVLSVLGTFIFLVSWWSERDSNTQIVVASSDANHIVVSVRNLGRNPSILGTPRLLFDKLPSQETTLDFSKATNQAGGRVIQPKASATITLTTYLPDSIPTRRRSKQYSHKQFEEILAGKTLADVPMTLEIEVTESDDPSGGLWPFAKPRPFHVRADHFAAERIADFIDGSIRP